MARAVGLSKGKITAVRELAAAVPIVADSVTLTDANIDPTKTVNCSGYDTVFVGCEIDVPAGASMVVEALFRDPNAVDDGSRWKRLPVGARPGVTPGALAAEDTGSIDGSKMTELRVHGHSSVFFRVVSVAGAGATTGGRILLMPGGARKLG